MVFNKTSCKIDKAYNIGPRYVSLRAMSQELVGLQVTLKPFFLIKTPFNGVTLVAYQTSAQPILYV